jgi:glutamine synthetase
MDFSGSELIKGEPDASSFPSGGLRATFEARGYTAWDPTSFAFIKEDTLYIPTAFCSYSGEALDKKTPLLKSMEALSDQALRILKLFGHEDVKRVIPSVGLEQEYFLIDLELFNKRPDLKICGRTLFGAPSPKGQELDDHYFGAIKPRVKEFMKAVDQRLWRFGIPAKMEHNEAAPAQHELVSVHTTANVSVDQNQLMMEEMKKVATSMGLACLLHEKPFAGLNGSGKHNNWSLQTDTGINLLESGDSPSENAQFLLFLSAVIRAVDKYQGLLRLSASSAGNDCRLGGLEAPPSVISIFLGEELVSILDSVAKGIKKSDNAKERMIINVHVIPDFPKDSTDRNRTSPMAFTGNKFEFRMLGSSFNAAGPNIVLNSAVAEVLSDFADQLENAEDFDRTLNEIVGRTYTKHKKIIFNGNNYDKVWHEEAEKRGLVNYPSTVEATDSLRESRNIKMLDRYGVLGTRELESRREVILEGYCKTVTMEARTLLEMVRRNVLPDSEKYLHALSLVQRDYEATGSPANRFDSYRIDEIRDFDKHTGNLRKGIEDLENAVSDSLSYTDLKERALCCKNEVLSAMDAIRHDCDWLESRCPSEMWSLPTYMDLLFSV